MLRLKMVALAATVSLIPLSSDTQAATCTGNCGTNTGTLDGSIVPSPGSFGRYDWVSTNGGVNGAGQIASVGGTNGSQLVSDEFFASAGQVVSFDFNYITSDGSGFADYGFAELRNLDTGAIVSLFTARTQPSGTIAPGFGLPGVAATLTPGTVPINPGASFWSPLGGDSGQCYQGPTAGCGNTGWIQSDYTIGSGQAGTYELRFGVTNWSDTALDSGLAFSGLVLDGSTIGDGSSFTNPLLPGEINQQTGAFEFEFTVSAPSQVVWIDPLVATGYDYTATGALITSAIFPDLGDLDGYEVWDSGLTTLLTTVLGGVTFNFAGPGVTGFALRDIETSLMLDPTNVTAFVTGLTFAVTGTTTINVSQTPVTTFVPDVNNGVPEPGTWAMMLAGFGLMGAALRKSNGRRRQKVAVRFAT